MKSNNETLKELLPTIAEKNPSLAQSRVVKFLSVDGITIVIFQPNIPPDVMVSLYDNLFGFDSDGNFKWQIEVTGKNAVANNHVADIWLKDGATYLDFWVGYEALLDIETGKWTETNPDARPW